MIEYLSRKCVQWFVCSHRGHRFPEKHAWLFPGLLVGPCERCGDILTRKVEK